jgi:hypothetical protein
MVTEPGSGGRHRVGSPARGGLLAAGVVLLAASAASPVTAPPPSDQPDLSGLAGADLGVVGRPYEPWVPSRNAATPPSTPAPEPSATAVVEDAGPVIPAVFTGDIPATVLDAYRRARDATALSQPGCRLPLELLAAIGKVETGHARGGQVDSRGTTLRPILGPALNGIGFAAIRDTDRGRLDGDTVWDRAVGPMQFIPGTWQGWASDGNGDRHADPHNVYDASLAAARYLCAANRDLGTPEGLDQAILSYNRSASYRNLVLRWMATYTGGTVVVPDAAGLSPVPVAVDIPDNADRPPAPVGGDVPATTPLSPPNTTTPPPGSTPPISSPPTSSPPSSTPPSSPPTTVPPSTTPPSTTPTLPPTSEPSEPSPPAAPETPPPPNEPPTTTTAGNLVTGLVCGVGTLVGGLLSSGPPPCSAPGETTP